MEWLANKPVKNFKLGIFFEMFGHSPHFLFSRACKMKTTTVNQWLLVVRYILGAFESPPLSRFRL